MSKRSKSDKKSKEEFLKWIQAQKDESERLKLNAKKVRNQLTVSHENYTILLPNGRPVRFALCYDKSRLDSFGKKIKMTRFKWYTMFDEIRHHMFAEKKYRLPLLDGRTIGDMKVLFADFDKLDDRFINDQLSTNDQWNNFYQYLNDTYGNSGVVFRSPSGKCKIAFITQVSNPYRLLTDDNGRQYLRSVLITEDYELIDSKGIYRCFITESILNDLQQLFDKPYGYIDNDINRHKSNRNNNHNYSKFNRNDDLIYSIDHYTSDPYRKMLSSDYYDELSEIRKLNDEYASGVMINGSNSLTVSDHNNCNSKSSHKMTCSLAAKGFDKVSNYSYDYDRTENDHTVLLSNYHDNKKLLSERNEIDNREPRNNSCKNSINYHDNDELYTSNNYDRAAGDNDNKKNICVRESEIDNREPRIIADEIYEPYTISNTHDISDSFFQKLITDSRRKHMEAFIHFLLEHPRFASERGYGISRNKLAVTFKTSRTGSTRIIETSIKLGILEEIKENHHRWGKSVINYTPNVRPKFYRVTGQMLEYMKNLYKGDARLETKTRRLPQPEKVVFEDGNTQDHMFQLAVAAVMSGLNETQWANYYTRIPKIQERRRWYHMKYNYDSVKAWADEKKSLGMFNTR